MNDTATTTKLANGLTIVSSKAHPHVESLYLELVVRVGARNDSDEFFGLAHFVEHVLAQIAETSVRRHEWIDDYMIDTFDASTDQEKTTYYVGAAKQDARRALHFVLSVLQPPVLTTKIIEQHKAVVIEELLEYLSEDSTKADQYFASNYYENNTLSRGTVLGTIETIKSFTVKDIEQYIDQYYTPENCFLTITGNFELASLIETIEALVHAPSTPQHLSHQPYQNAASTPHPYQKEVIYWEQDTEQNSLVLSRQVFIPNIETSIQLLVLMNMLEQYLNFFGRQQGLIYSLSASYHSYRGHTDIIIESSFSPDKTEAICTWLLKELHDFTKQLDVDTVELYKQNLLKNTTLELPYPRTVLVDLSWYYYYFEKPLSTTGVMTLIKQVTTKQLLALHKEIFNGQNKALMLTGVITGSRKQVIEKLFRPYPQT